MVLIAKKQLEQSEISVFFLLNFIWFLLFNIGFIINDAESINILGIEQGHILLFSATSSSISRVNIKMLQFLNRKIFHIGFYNDRIRMYHEQWLEVYNWAMENKSYTIVIQQP